MLKVQQVAHTCNCCAYGSALNPACLCCRLLALQCHDLPPQLGGASHGAACAHMLAGQLTLSLAVATHPLDGDT
jgi:hypothetical protein